MVSLLRRSLSFYKEHGARALLEQIARKLYCTAISKRGHYSLTLNGHTVLFSAPTPDAVRQNRRRFKEEKRELRDFLGEITKDDVVYDIGANTGLYSLFAAKECTDGEVIAFEPYPPNVDVLRKDIDRNRFSNIQVKDVALSDSVGKIQFNQPEQSTIGYGSSSISSRESGSSVDVSTTTGDNLIRNGEIPEPDVMKIDVEGAESLVIDGLETTLSSSNCRLVYCEVHLPGIDHRPSVEDFDTTPEDLRSKLEELGFTVEVFDQRNELELFYKIRK